MAELIEEIISQSAFKQVEEMKLNLKDLQKQFEDLLKTTGKPLFTGSGGGGAAQSKQQMDELDKVKKQIIQTQDRLTAMTTAYGQALADERVKLAQLNQELKDNTRANQAAAGSLDEMQLKLKKAQEEYRKLSETVRNSDVGKKLLADIQAQNAAVSSLEQGMGKFQRNVGNYASATMSLSQVFREIPAFTYSAQTGILGLSNNLPILIDQFKAVALETGSSVKALKVFATSMFSMTNLLTIAIGLFTIFSKEIFSFINATEQLTDAEKEQLEVRKQLNKSYADEYAKAILLLDVAVDLTNTYTEREKAYNQLNGMYPELLSNMTKEEALNGGLIASYDGLLIAIEKTMRRKATLSQLEAAISDKVRIENEIRRMTNPAPGDFVYYRPEDIDKLNGQLAMANDRIKSINESLIRQKEIEAGAYGQRPAGVPKSVATPTVTAQTKERLKKQLEESINQLDDISFVRWRFGTPKEDNEINRNMKASANAMLEEINKYIEANPAKVKLNMKFEVDIKELAQGVAMAVDTFLKYTEVFETMQDTRHNLEMQRINDEQTALNSKYDAEEQRIKRNFTSQAQQEEELKKLAAQREAEQKKIDRDRKKAIRERAAAQKQIDIAQTIANTAKAVTAALSDSSVPYYLAVINAFAAGAAGLAQIERIRSTPLPEFAKGTDSAPEGYAVVGEKGHELVIEPSGKSWVTPAKDTVTYLKKGSKVIPNDKLMSMVKDSAYVQLANLAMPVTTDIYGKALVEQFEALSADVRGLKAVMENKDMAVKVMGNFDHYMHVKRNIR